MDKRILLALLVFCMLMPLAAAWSTNTFNASSLITEQSTTGYQDIDIGNGSTNHGGPFDAQTFSVGSLGYNGSVMLDYVEIGVCFDPSAADAPVAIGLKATNATGYPAGEDIVNVTLPTLNTSETRTSSQGYDSCLGTGERGGYIRANLSTILQAGTTYAITAKALGSVQETYAAGFWQANTTSAYAGGAFFQSVDYYNNTWFRYSTTDGIFRIHVTPRLNGTQSIVNFTALGQTLGIVKIPSSVRLVNNAYFNITGNFSSSNTTQSSSPITGEYFAGPESGAGAIGDTINWRGQTFTVGTVSPNVAINISKVALKLNRYTAANTTVIVGIRATNATGMPTGADLANGSVDSSTLIYNVATWTNITLNNAVVLSPSTTYALVFRVNTSSSAAVDVSLNNSNAYSNGARALSSDGGVNWIPSATMDYLFYTYGNTTTSFNYTRNFWLEVGAVDTEKEFSVNEILNTTLQTANLQSKFNQYLSSCTYVDGYCNVPIIFGASNVTDISYSAIILNNYGMIVNSTTYNASAYETESQFFSANISYDQIYYTSVTAYLVYNNTRYSAVVTTNGNTATLYRYIDIPKVNIAENRSFYWEIYLSNGTATDASNSSTVQQYVNNTFITLCNTTYSTVALNFTIMDETTNQNITGAIETAYSYYLGSGSTFETYSMANTSENRSNYQLCISPSTRVFTINGITSYYKAGYTRRDYLFNNFSASSTLQSIPLYLLATADSDMVTISVIDEGLTAVSGAYIYVQHWDIATDTFSTVSVLQTDESGEAIVNMRLNDAWYRFMVVYNGRVYLVTQPTKQASTTRQLQINLNNPLSYNQFSSVSGHMTFTNSTNVFSFTFLDSSGAVNQGCLKIFSLQSNATTLLSTQCIQTTSGTLTYQLTQNGTYVAQGIARLNSNYSNAEQMIDSMMVTLGVPSRFTTHGTSGYVISMILFCAAALIGVSSGSVLIGMFMQVVVLYLVNKLGWLNISTSVLITFISVLVMIGFTLKRRNA